jgi:hypothetical protein
MRIRVGIGIGYAVNTRPARSGHMADQFIISEQDEPGSGDRTGGISAGSTKMASPREHPKQSHLALHDADGHLTSFDSERALNNIVQVHSGNGQVCPVRYTLPAFPFQEGLCEGG